jgi:hypothetical protein
MNTRQTCSHKDCYWFWPDAKDLCGSCEEKRVWQKTDLNMEVKRAFGNPLNGTWSCNDCHFSIYPKHLRERQDEFKWRIGAEGLHHGYVGPLCPTCGKSLEYDDAE